MVYELVALDGPGALRNNQRAFEVPVPWGVRRVGLDLKRFKFEILETWLETR